MQVKTKPMPLIRDKTVTATKRLPLWRLSDEMYMERQLAPDPDLSWTEVRRDQARMREMVLDQQKRDMRTLESEIAGQRLPPTVAIGSIRKGEWLEGRVSRLSRKGVLVDVGAYTPAGEWIDGYLQCGQFREDGFYVKEEYITKEVFLGERVMVRVRECEPSTGTLFLSMRTTEDLPELFMGKPRPYNSYDLKTSMQVTGIIRRVWEKWALVDIGSDRLARIHVRDHKRDITRYGFIKLGRLHKYANTCFAVGAQMDLWIKSMENSGQVFLTCNRPRSLPRQVAADGRPEQGWLQDGIENAERLTHEQRRDREKAEAEKETWKPKVPHVDEWLEDAYEPDEETDSWVAKTERELFEEMSEEELVKQEDELTKDFALAQRVYTSAREDTLAARKKREMEKIQEEDEDFADDDFAEDDFMDGGEMAASDMGFGPHAFPATELDGWVLDDDKDGESKDGELTVDEVEAFFSEDDDEDDDSFDEGFRSGGPRWNSATPPPR